MLDETQMPTTIRKKLPPNLEKIKYGKYSEDHPDYPVYLYLKENDISIDETGSEIIDFYRGKSVLITGATGFIGKLLVEKLLRCCKDIEKIYLIIRPKKGKDPQARINEYFSNWVFVRLLEIRPDCINKVVGIGGDFEEPGLGLSEESRQLIRDKVNIIIHIAATVRFDENLKTAVRINIKGTQEILRLAKECKNMEVFTHMSSAFSNCHYKDIKEEFYPPLMDPDEAIQLTELLSKDMVERITSGLLGSVPNGYTFTKQIAEDVIRKEGVGIPTCLHRPSIVIAGAREPIRGWVDNIYGPVGLIEGAIIGLLHVMLGNPNGKCDMVPADYVINNCLAATCKTAKDRILDKPQIFNFTLSHKNPLYWKNLGMAGHKGEGVGSVNVIAKGFHRFTNWLYWYMFLNFILHTIPAHIADFFAVRFGKKPQLVKAYEKIGRFVSVLSFFTLTEWTFDSTNTQKLWESLSEKDKKNFWFDVRDIDWQKYFDTSLVAMREFLIKEFLDDLEEGRAYLNKVFWICRIAYGAIITLTLYLSIYVHPVFWILPSVILVIYLFYLFTDDR